MKKLVLLFLCFVPAMLWAQNSGQHVHKVEKGQTMYSIAKAYGVSMEALELANPTVVEHQIKAGMQLVIPQPPAGMIPVLAEGQTESAPMRVLKVGVLLPLEEENERSSRYLEFYRGLLMAADSVKCEGANLVIYAWDSGTTGAQMRELTQRGEMASLDVIFGPTDLEQIQVLARFCKEKGIRLVLPFSHGFNTEGYPNVYSATASQQVVAQNAAELMLDMHEGKNFVLVRTGQTDKRGRDYTGAIAKAAASRNLQLHEIILSAEADAWREVLSPEVENCIIVDNAAIGTLTALIGKLNALRQQLPGYTFSLQGYPEWQGFTAKHKMDMHAYNTYNYCTYYKFDMADNVRRFEAKYLANFNAPMRRALPQMGLLGFDLGYYFLHGLSALGDAFDIRQSEMRCTPLQSNFHFLRTGAGNGFVNTAIQLINYNPDLTRNGGLYRVTPE